MASRGFRLAPIIALAYTLVIVYASLQPFSGWRTPPEEVFGFLGAPWPRYVTAGDVMLNVLAYLPFGVMLFAALRPVFAEALALLGALLIAASVSFAVESVQMFLPMRIASNLDLLTNISGAAIGALAALILALPAFAGNPLATIRRNLVRRDVLGDCGLLLVALWILTQFHQAPLALSNGDVREILGIEPLLMHTPQAYLLVGAGVVALVTVAIGLLVSLVLQPNRPPYLPIATTLLLAATAKSVATVTLTRSISWWQWMTPGVAMGAGAGILALAALLRVAPAARAIAGLACIAAGVFIVNAAPENPYQPVPAFMLSPQPTHLANLSLIARSLSQVWPLIAAVFLLFVWRDSRLSVHGQGTPTVHP